MEKKMSIPNREYVDKVIQHEGFEYAFVHYTDFKEVEDDYFHELRLKFIDALKNLKEYLQCQ